MTEQEFYTFPQRHIAEVHLIKSILDSGHRFVEVFSIVNRADFSQEAFASAWDWFTEMTDKGLRITIYTLNQNYGSHRHFSFIHSTVSNTDEPTIPALLTQYAEDVAAHARRERIAQGIALLQTMATGGSSSTELSEGIQRLFQDTFSQSVKNSFKSAKELVSEIEEQIRNPKLVRRMKTGFPTLDKMLKGGIKPGMFVVIGGRTGGCKTVLAMNLAVQMALDGNAVAAFSLEMPAVDLLMRCILSEGIQQDEQMAFDSVRSLPLWIDDTSDITVRGICAKIQLMQALKGIRVGLVDYLQLIGPEIGSKESRERIVADMSRRLKVTAKDNQVATIALSQLNDKGEVRESRAIEQDADVVIYVMDNPNGDWFLRLCKNRGGESHGPISRVDEDSPGIPIRFHKQNFRFTEI